MFITDRQWRNLKEILSLNIRFFFEVKGQIVEKEHMEETLVHLTNTS